MAKVRSWAGLDVHARSVLAVSMDSDTGELRVRRLSGDTSEVVEFCCSLPGPTRMAYEAGPTGYGLARALTAGGVGCVVAAPGKIERPAQDRVKTDRRVAERLLCLRGIDTLSAVGLCAEIGDFERFERPKQLMSCLGLVPSEDTSGEKRRQGAITKSGSRHARRLLIEAAWHDRRPPRLGHHARTPPSRPTHRGDSDRLESAAAAAPHLAPARHRARQATHDRRGRCRPPTHRARLGDRHHRLTPTSCTTPVKEAAGTAPATTRETPAISL
jgi:transposase